MMDPAEFERRALARRRALERRQRRHDAIAAAAALLLVTAMIAAGLWLALRADGPLGSFMDSNQGTAHRATNRPQQ